MASKSLCSLEFESGAVAFTSSHRISTQKDALFESPSTVLLRTRTLGPENEKRYQTLIVS